MIIINYIDINIIKNFYNQFQILIKIQQGDRFQQEQQYTRPVRGRANQESSNVFQPMYPEPKKMTDSINQCIQTQQPQQQPRQQEQPQEDQRSYQQQTSIANARYRNIQRTNESHICLGDYELPKQNCNPSKERLYPSSEYVHQGKF